MNRLRQMVNRAPTDDAEIVEADIRSPNYDPGVDGWCIFKDGSVEFNDAVFRGEIVSEAGTIGIFDLSADGLSYGTAATLFNIGLFPTTPVIRMGAATAPGEHAMSLSKDGLDFAHDTGAFSALTLGFDGSDNGQINVYKADHSLGIALTGEDITATGKIRADTAFNLNGTDGASGSFDPASVTSIVVEGGIITGWS